MLDGSRITRALTLAYAEIERLRAGGNPFHDLLGKFTMGPGGAGQGKRKRKRKRKLADFADHELGMSHVGHGWRKAAMPRRESRKRVWDTKDDPSTHGRAERRLQKIYDAKPLWTSPKFIDSKGRTDDIRITKSAYHLSIRGYSRYKVEDTGGDAHATNDYDKAVRIAKKMSVRLHNDPDLEPLQRSVMRDEFPKRKSQKKNGERSLQGLSRKMGYGGDSRTFAPTRTSKASSAEAILRYCLRQRGWTSLYRRGELTSTRRLKLLSDMREYGRAWLRHEAAELFAAHGRHDDNLMVDRDGLPDAALSLVNGGLDRALGAAIKHHVGRFFRRAKQFTRELILAGTLALSGPKDLDGDDIDQINRQAAEQDSYYDAFEAEVNALPPPQLAPDLGLNQVTIIAPPSMSMPQFIARAEQYGSAVWGAAQEVARAQVIRERVWVEERRVHGMLKDDMCSICREAVAMGWQPIGTLPAIGDSECLSSCHCYFKWRDAEGKEKSQVRKMRRKSQLTRRPVVSET